MDVNTVSAHSLAQKTPTQIHQLFAANKPLYQRLLCEYLQNPELFQSCREVGQCLSRLCVNPQFKSEATAAIQTATVVNSFWLSIENFSKEVCAPNGSFEIFLVLNDHCRLSLENAKDSKGRPIVDALKQGNQQNRIYTLRQHGVFSPADRIPVADRWLFSAERQIMRWQQAGGNLANYPALSPLTGRPAPTWPVIINQIITSPQRSQDVFALLLRDIGHQILPSDCSLPDVEKLYTHLVKANPQMAEGLLERSVQLGVYAHCQILYRLLKYESKSLTTRENLLGQALKSRHLPIAHFLLKNFEVDFKSDWEGEEFGKLAKRLIEVDIHEQSLVSNGAVYLNTFLIHFFLGHGVHFAHFDFDFGQGKRETIYDKITSELSTVAPSDSRIQELIFLANRISPRGWYHISQLDWYINRANKDVLFAHGFDPHWWGLKEGLSESEREAYLRYLIMNFDSSGNWSKHSLRQYLRGDTKYPHSRLSSQSIRGLLELAFAKQDEVCILILLLLIPHQYGYLTIDEDFDSLFPNLDAIISKANKLRVRDDEDWEISVNLSDDTINALMAAYLQEDKEALLSSITLEPSARLIAKMLKSFSVLPDKMMSKDECELLINCQESVARYADTRLEIEALSKHSSQMADYHIEQLAEKIARIVQWNGESIFPCSRSHIFVKATYHGKEENLVLTVFDTRLGTAQIYELTYSKYSDKVAPFIGRLLKSDPTNIAKILEPYPPSSPSTQVIPKGAFSAFFALIQERAGDNLTKDFKHFVMREVKRFAQAEEGRFLSEDAKARIMQFEERT